MQIEYNKKTRTMDILGFEDLDNPKLYINEEFIKDLVVGDSTYVFSVDGFYKIRVDYTILEQVDSGEVDEFDEPIFITVETPMSEELGWVLVIEYSKDKLRLILVDYIEDERYDGLPEIYIKNRKIIRELEVTFYSGNLRRAELLFDEIKWN
jgi:hypothetical protein